MVLPKPKLSILQRRQLFCNQIKVFGLGVANKVLLQHPSDNHHYHDDDDDENHHSGDHENYHKGDHADEENLSFLSFQNVVFDSDMHICINIYTFTHLLPKTMSEPDSLRWTSNQKSRQLL